jgi:uncharacterized protein
LGVASLAIAAFARFDADPMALRDPGSASVKAFDRLFDDPDTAPYRLSVLTDGPVEAARLASQLEPLAEVDEVISLADFVPSDQDDKLLLIEYAAIGLDLAFADGQARDIEADALARLMVELETRAGPGAERLAAALADFRGRAQQDPGLAGALEADLLAYWPHELQRLKGQLLAAHVSPDDIPQAIRARYEWGDGAQRLEIVPTGDTRNPAQRRAFVNAVLDVAPQATGPARNVQAAGETIRWAMIQAILAAIAAVSVLLWFVLRDVRLIAIILTPLLLAASLTVATGVIFNLPFNFANVIVLPLLVGVGIDSGIHLALKARRTKNSLAVYRSPTPRAVLLSGLTTIASFGSLSFSPHQGTASMGALLTIAIGWTLVCTIFVLPLLMQRFSRA